MSDEPFGLPPVPLMSAERARDVSCGYQAMADHLNDVGYLREAARLERQAQWWMTYSIALAQMPPDGGKP
jgi:hypothetical protein